MSLPPTSPRALSSVYVMNAIICGTQSAAPYLELMDLSLRRCDRKESWEFVGFKEVGVTECLGDSQVERAALNCSLRG